MTIVMPRTVCVVACVALSALSTLARAELASGAGIAVEPIDLQAELVRQPVNARQALLAKADTVGAAATNLALRRALAAQAEREGLSKDALVAARVRLAQERALSDIWLERFDAANEPSDETLENYARTKYKAEPKLFEAPAESRASHILIRKTDAESRAKAEGLLAQLRAGANFEQMARTQSTDTGNAAKGGDLGWFGAGRMVKPFDDAVNALKAPGDLSDVVETQFGYHLIKLTGRRPAGQRPYEEVRDEIKKQARVALLNDARQKKMSALRDDIKVNAAEVEAWMKAQQRTDAK